MFTADQIQADPILKYFSFEHLSMPMQGVSEEFYKLAHFIVTHIARSAERTVALRKLLEAKDAAVRAVLP